GLFLFSSRRRHTRSKRDWSSDVCSSDLVEASSQFHAEVPEQQAMVFGSGTGVQSMSLNQVTVYDAAGLPGGGGGTLRDIQQETGLSIQLVMRTLKELDKQGLITREGDRWVRVDGQE